MSAGECVFCREYRVKKNLHQFIHDHPEYYGLDSSREQDITVAMVVRTYRRGYKRNASRTTDYRYQGCGYALNYCPECGKSLKGAPTENCEVKEKNHAEGSYRKN